jgi:tetratricopeptide (TPR) repeat protein
VQPKTATERLIQSGPQPVAQIAQRARNSHTGAAMCQNAAHYLGEVGAALAASYWFARAGARSPALDKTLSSMFSRGPSYGTWIGVLRESASVAGAEALASLSRPLALRDPIDALAAVLLPRLEDGPFGSKGPSLRDAFARAQTGGILGFFDFLVAFRNAVYGHASMLPESESRALAQPFLEAVSSLLVDPALFEGSWLGQPSASFLASSRPQWKKLAGLYVEFIDGPPEPPPGGALHFVAGDRILRAPMFVIAEEDATGLARFGFLSRLVGPTKGGIVRPEALREVEYLDYVSGPFRSTAVEDARALIAPLVDASGEASAASEPAKERPIAASERRFGEFILDETKRLGSGAMGEVFRATQPSLARDVALKVLPPSLARDPVKMGRFNREVQALARCDHPNVVHVYAFGVEDGRPWYAMELFEGSDLSRFLAEPGTRDRAYHARMARLFAGAAGGIAEIHRRGVVHRDIKPSNLMLSGDRLVVMDLGLAKASDESAAYTRSEGKEFVGSVLYAAPEQIEANLLGMDHRADIYGLGATLYEAITAKPMYEGTVEQILERKLRKEPRPPRSIDASIPADLEVIVMKAVARDPPMRYATAEAMADDLMAFAEGRAITARPASWTYHLRMFHAQNRALVRLAAAGVGILAAVLVAGFARITEEREAAEGHRRRAEGLMSFMLVDVRDKLEPIGKLDVLDEVARRSMDYYAAIPGDDGDRESSRLRALALDNLGDVRLAQGDIAGALRQYESAERIRRTQLDGTAELRHDLSISSDKIGDVRFAQGDTTEALRRYRSALEIRTALFAQDPESARWGRSLHSSHGKVGSVLAARGETQEALDSMRRACVLMERLVQRHPGDTKLELDLARSRRRIASLLLQKSDLDGAVAEYRAVMEIDQRLANGDPSNLAQKHDVAIDHVAVGNVLLAKRDIDAALAAFKAANGLLAELVAREPSHAVWKRSLSASHQGMGEVHAEHGDFADALREFRAALAIAEQLAALDGTNAERQRDLCVGVNNVGDMLELLGDTAGALDAYRRYLEISKTLASTDPTNVAWQRDLAIAHSNVGRVLLTQKKIGPATEHARADLEITTNLAEREPANLERQRDLALSREALGDALSAAGDRTAALGEYRSARAVVEELLRGGWFEGDVRSRAEDLDRKIAGLARR